MDSPAAAGEYRQKWAWGPREIPGPAQFRSKLAVPMRYTIALVPFAFLAATCCQAAAEEISLKDGTKIVGHMTAVTPDRIEVETSYGKMQLNRNDIVTISFPQSGSDPKASDAAPANVNLPKIDESLSGTQYVNRTGKFSLTLPPDWMIEPSLRRTAATLAAFTSKDKMRFSMVIQEDYPGSLESYKEITMLNARRTLSNFEELADSNVTIDGKSALLVFYRGGPMIVTMPRLRCARR